MRTLMKVTMSDMYTANAAITSGKMQEIIQKITFLISPQCQFFYSENGFRAMLFAFDMKNASMIPQISEPIFLGLNAKVEFYPCMDPSDLALGLGQVQKSLKENAGVNTNLS